MARGNRRASIFHDGDNRRFFLSTLSEACPVTGWRVHAWVLMGNPYYLFIETPESNLVAGMSWWQNTVTRRYSVRHMAWSRLFGDCHKAVLVEGANSYHYRERRTGGSGTRRKGLATHERIRSAKTGSRGAALKNRRRSRKKGSRKTSRGVARRM